MRAFFSWGRRSKFIIVSLVAGGHAALLKSALLGFEVWALQRCQ